MLRFMFGICGLLSCVATPSVAQQTSVLEKQSGRFFVAGTGLHFDSDITGSDLPAEIDESDFDRLRDLLRQNPKVKTLVLNSSGGSLWAADEMGRVVLDYGLDTHVDGECSSACVTVFLSGTSRTMARGSKIGFHQNSWSEDSMRDYYKSWFGHDDGWANPFDFASWVYVYTQTQAYDHLTYMVERGVDAEFAIRSERPVSDFWYPSRAELTAAGVLRGE